VVAPAVGRSLFTTAAPASAVVPLEGASRAVAATPTKPVAKDAKKKKKKVVKKVVKKVAKAKALKPVKLQILSIADLHGYLQPPSDRAGQLTVAGGGTVSAGGAAYLATHLHQLRQGNPNSITVAAGDFVGASQSLSSTFADEPAIEMANALKVQVSTVGNHEFDAGVKNLLRLQYGGCDPAVGCRDSTPYAGAAFPYLAANVVYKPGAAISAPAGSKGYGSWFRSRTGRTILPPTFVKTVGGIKVGFIGVTLKNTPNHVKDKAGIKDILVGEEVRAANLAAKDLRAAGVRAIVLLLHQGGAAPIGAPYNYDCNAGGSLRLYGPAVDLMRKFDASIDYIVSGHGHQAYVCNIPDPAGKSRWVSGASSYGRLITETQLTLDPRTQDVVRSSVRAKNVLVSRDVPPAPEATAIIQKWESKLR